MNTYYETHFFGVPASISEPRDTNLEPSLIERVVENEDGEELERHAVAEVPAEFIFMTGSRTDRESDNSVNHTFTYRDAD